MRQARTAIKNIERLSRGIFITLTVLTVVFAASYAALVSKSILNAVSKEKIEREIASLSSDLSDAEFQYISAKGAVTTEKAHELGFVSATNKTTFVTLAKPVANVAVR